MLVGAIKKGKKAHQVCKRRLAAGDSRVSAVCHPETGPRALFLSQPSQSQIKPTTSVPKATACSLNNRGRLSA